MADGGHSHRDSRIFATIRYMLDRLIFSRSAPNLTNHWVSVSGSANASNSSGWSLALGLGFIGLAVIIIVAEVYGWGRPRPRGQTVDSDTQRLQQPTRFSMLCTAIVSTVVGLAVIVNNCIWPLPHLVVRILLIFGITVMLVGIVYDAVVNARRSEASHGSDRQGRV